MTLLALFPIPKSEGCRTKFLFSDFFYFLVITLRPSRLKEQSQFDRIVVSLDRFTTLEQNEVRRKFSFSTLVN